LLDRLGAVAGDFSRDYDVSPDGRRFVVVRTIGTTPNAPASSLIVVQHFDQEVASKAPAR
jgi:hypothetical protein